MLMKIVFEILPRLALFAMLLTIGLTNYTHDLRAEVNKKPKIIVSIPPLTYFAKRIGGNDFEIETAIAPGQSPATYEVTPRQLAGFLDAAVFFRVGVPFEKQLVQKIAAAFKTLNIVDVQRGIELQYQEHTHSHGEASEDTGDLDPHTWLNPSLAKIQAKNIFEELVRINPTGKNAYEENFNLLSTDLDSLKASIARRLSPYKGRSFYAFHPAFGYFGAAFGLKQVAVEIEGKEPSARYLSELIDRAKADSIKAIFVQPQFAQKSAQTIAKAIGAELITIDPLNSNYAENMENIAAKLLTAFEKMGK